MRSGENKGKGVATCYSVERMKGDTVRRGMGQRRMQVKETWLEQGSNGRSVIHVGNSGIDWKAERADQETKGERYSENRIKPHGRGLSQVTRTRVLRVARVRGCESCEERGARSEKERKVGR